MSESPIMANKIGSGDFGRIHKFFNGKCRLVIDKNLNSAWGSSRALGDAPTFFIGRNISEASVKKKFKILIADRNPHVREFLKREMVAEGYEVCLAENSREVLQWAYHSDSPDLLILDPDLPDAEETAVLKKLENRIPVLPTIIHTFISDYAEEGDFLTMIAFVEKEGNSIERLKEVVSDILNKTTSSIKALR